MGGNSPTDAGLAKLEFTRRLGSDWRDLGTVLDLPAWVLARFDRGHEAVEIWDIVAVDQAGLERLVAALRHLGRHDLADELAAVVLTTPSPFEGPVRGLDQPRVRTSEAGRPGSGDHPEQASTYPRRSTPRVEAAFSSVPVASRPRRLSLDDLESLLDIMLLEVEISSVSGLHRITEFLPVPIRSAVPHSNVPRVHLLALISTCQEYATGRAALVSALKLGLANSASRHRAIAAMDRYWPVDTQ